MSNNFFVTFTGRIGSPKISHCFCETEADIIALINNELKYWLEDQCEEGIESVAEWFYVSYVNMETRELIYPNKLAMARAAYSEVEIDRMND